MSQGDRKLILCVDDDEAILGLLEIILTRAGYQVMMARNAVQALAAADTVTPNLILMDIRMPLMDGCEVCARLKEKPRSAAAPVICVTSYDTEETRARALAAGASDFVTKPFNKDDLLDRIATQLEEAAAPPVEPAPDSWYARVQPDKFPAFLTFLYAQLSVDAAVQEKCDGIAASQLYTIAPLLGVGSAAVAQNVAAFLRVPHMFQIDPTRAEWLALPAAYCREHGVLVIHDDEHDDKHTYVFSNPFDLDSLWMMERVAGLLPSSRLAIASPEAIMTVLHCEGEDDGSAFDTPVIEPDVPDIVVTKEDAVGARVVAMTHNILDVAVSERASDIHIEPKQGHTVVRFRVDGDLREVFRIPRELASKIVSRFKILAALDIAERRLPQDGGFATNLQSRMFNLRVATVPANFGEGLVIRMLEPESTPRKLHELGLTSTHAQRLIELGGRRQGFIIIVGGTGSGKTTTVHSLLHQIDCATRSVVTIEDPIEYRLPFATQQQVNLKAGVTFDVLLRSVVRQDPDILLLGEMRDEDTARTAVDFVSIGHLTLTTLHTTNATTAVFRLERLGVDRSTMADTVACVVAQTLVKRLCPHCKRSVPISDEERRMLEPFTDDIPAELARSTGCMVCKDTGYQGREAVCEIIEFDAEAAAMVRANCSVREIRAYVQRSGYNLITDHAITKLRTQATDFDEVRQKVLVNEQRYRDALPGSSQPDLDLRTDK